MSASAPELSVVVPAYNEAAAIEGVLTALVAELRKLPCTTEVVVVDDGSKDATADAVRRVEGVRLVQNPVNLGYGHSLLRGIAASRGELIGIIDADGTYPAPAFAELHAMIRKGADHAIAQRTGKHFQRIWSLRHYYRWLCWYVVGQRVPDANSGLRIFRRKVVETLRGDLCMGFSFTTSLTLASIMSGFVVTFSEIPYAKRIGRSHVRYRDILRTLQFLFQLIAVYNPLKLFLPFVLLSGAMALAGFGYGLWLERLTGMLSGVIMTGVTFLLVGMAGHAYIVSRVGLHPAVEWAGIARGRSAASPPTNGPEGSVEPATSIDSTTEPSPAGAREG